MRRVSEISFGLLFGMVIAWLTIFVILTAPVHAQTTTSTSSSTSTSLGVTVRGCTESATCQIIPGGIGAFPPALCTPGTIWVDTKASDDTNCTTTANNSLCLCTAPNRWTALENN